MHPAPPLPLVITVGYPVVDHRFRVKSYPPEEPRTDAGDYRAVLGGPAAVAATAVSRLGGAARILAAVGNDPNGRFARAQLELNGVDVEWLVVDDALDTGVCSVMIDDAGERYIVRHLASSLQSEAPWVSERALAGASVVLVHPGWPAGAKRAAEVAREIGLQVVVDLDRLDTKALALCGLATHVIADTAVGTALGGADGMEAHFGAGGAWWAVTLGEAGVLHAEGTVPAFPVRAVDSTGAGDVFHGAFALALAEGQAEVPALSFSAAAAAAHVATGRPPSRPELAGFIGSAVP